VNVSESSDPERLNDICVAKSVTKPLIVMIGNFRTSKSLNVREREYRCLCSYYVINT
jgi:hypothetical protein